MSEPLKGAQGYENIAQSKVPASLLQTHSTSSSSPPQPPGPHSHPMLQSCQSLLPSLVASSLSMPVPCLTLS